MIGSMKHVVLILAMLLALLVAGIWVGASNAAPSACSNYRFSRSMAKSADQAQLAMEYGGIKEYAAAKTQMLKAWQTARHSMQPCKPLLRSAGRHWKAGLDHYLQGLLYFQRGRPKAGEIEFMHGLRLTKLATAEANLAAAR